MKTITFLLPGRAHRPVGGYKVICEYANRFAADGYAVNLVYPSYIKSMENIVLRFLKYPLRLIAWIVQGYSVKKWFNLREEVCEKVVPNLSFTFLPPSDIYIATAIETVSYLQKYPVSQDRKVYFIQGYETWNYPKSYVNSTYGYGFKNIVISRWLQNVVKSTDNDSCLINNGFDFSYFSLTNNIEDRDSKQIAMLYHENPVKGTKYGLNALSIVHDTFPDIKVTLFGVFKNPGNLPEWINYVRLPDRAQHNQIYNTASIFLAPSVEEGWGLTVGEAMICGAAVVCTDAECFSEMVQNEITGLVAPVKNSEAIAACVIRLIGDKELRVSLAKRGKEHISKFTWENSYLKFKNYISL